jgi:cysteine synthase
MPHPAAIEELIRRHPLLGLIGNTPLVPVPLFQRESPQVELLVKCEFLAGYDEALREVRRRHAANPDRYFFSDQYSNNANWQAHYDTTLAMRPHSARQKKVRTRHGCS